MSSQAESRLTENELSHEQVAAFLRAHSDFFALHPELTAELQIPHAADGAVSLVEHQVRTLRERNALLEQRLSELLEVARANESLVQRLQQLGLKLLVPRSPEDMLETVHASLREDYDADAVSLMLFLESRNGDCIGPARCVSPPTADEEKWLVKLLDIGRPRCGEWRPEQLEYVFGEQAGKIASAAVVPLERRGLLAIGSHQRERFNPSMGTDFLARVGELVTVAISHQQDLQPDG